jgi:hypothetical protein
MRTQQPDCEVRPGRLLLVWGLTAALTVGCRTDRTLRYWGEPGPEDVVATQLAIEEPEVCEPPSEAAVGSLDPRTMNDRGHDNVWDMTLQEAIQLALANNKVARTRNDYQSPGNQLLNSGEQVLSVYEPAIRESGVLFGSRGVEAALSSFDPVFNSSLTYGSNSAIQNNPFSGGGIPAGRQLDQDTGQFTASVTKNMAYGAQVGVAQNWTYTDSNQLLQLFPSVFTGNLQFSYQQPLWAGAGTEFTRIAGPVNPNVQAIAGVNQGVVIARINSDISLTEFEQQVKLMVFDVETLYWDLYQSYRNYDSLVQARDAALQTWRSVKAKSGSGLEGGGRADEAQAREQYFEARSRAETALGGPGGRGGDQGIYGIELQLRRMCGLPANDGRIIRPADEPGYSPVVHDWHGCLATAFARRSELRRQRWIIKSNELQLRAARSLANPQLSFISSYQLNGFGSNLFGPDGDAGSEGAQLQSAYRTQFQGDQTGWNVGLQFSVPLGLRSALTQVRHQELRLIKAQAVLEAQELEISHEMAGAFQSVDYWYQNAETNYNRRQAALENVEVLKADYELGRRPLDLLLQAQNRLAVAEVTWHRSVTEYCKSLAELQLRQGTLLDYNNVYLEEGAWSPEAWRDVERRAWARSHAFEAPRIDPLRSEPEPFAQPAGGTIQGDLQFDGLTPIEGVIGSDAGGLEDSAVGVPSPLGGGRAGGAEATPLVTPLPPGPDELKNRPFAPKLGEGEYFDGGETGDTGEE